MRLFYFRLRINEDPHIVTLAVEYPVIILFLRQDTIGNEVAMNGNMVIAARCTGEK